MNFDSFRDNCRQWDKSVQTYSTNQYIPIERGCFAIMFTNIGAVTARVGGMVIFPSATPGTALGDSRTLAAHLMDIYKGNLDLSFVAGAGGLVEIVQLYYV